MASLALATAHATQRPAAYTDRLDAYPIAIVGDVTKVVLTSRPLDAHGFQYGDMAVTVQVRGVERGSVAVGDTLSFQGSTIVRVGDLEGPISAIPPTLAAGDRVHVVLEERQGTLVVPFWAAFDLIPKAGSAPGDDP